jgi:cytidine deaminase
MTAPTARPSSTWTEADETLLAAARDAREHAWAPYSRFRVGAAVLSVDGRRYAGCNVENAAYGLCNCAERTALFSAVADGVRPGQLAALAVIGETEGPISPCGACRQVIFELGGPRLRVLLGNLGTARRVTDAATLLPDGFAFDGPASP